MKSNLPSQTPSGAFVHTSSRGSIQADLGGVGCLTACVDLEDCDGEVIVCWSTMRGGVAENAMSLAELARLLVVYQELVEIAKSAWPEFFKGKI